MKLAAVLWTVGSVFLRSSVEGKKVTYQYQENSHHVHTWKYWWTEGCPYWNYIRVETKDGAFREPGEPEDTSGGPGSVTVFGNYYYNCVGWNALKRFFRYKMEFPEFDGVHQVNGVKNATLSLESEGVQVTVEDCSFNDEYYKYVCDTMDWLELSLSFTQTAVACGGTYEYKDKSVERGPGFVIKTNSMSSCKDVTELALDLFLGDEHWKFEEGSMGTGHICKYKGGSSEKYTVL